MSSTTGAATANVHQGANRLILGIVLAIVTFWLFAQTTLNVAPTMREELRISESLNNIAVSITALFSGIFIVVAGGLADRLGRLKITYFGKMASSLGAAFGVAISAALFTSLSGLNTSLAPLSDLFLGRTDNVGIRFAAAIALLFNVIMVIVAIIAIASTVPRDDPRARA